RRRRGLALGRRRDRRSRLPPARLPGGGHAPQLRRPLIKQDPGRYEGSARHAADSVATGLRTVGDGCPAYYSPTAHFCSLGIHCCPSAVPASTGFQKTVTSEKPLWRSVGIGIDDDSPAKRAYGPIQSADGAGSRAGSECVARAAKVACTHVRSVVPSIG